MVTFRWNERIISPETYFELSEESYFLGIRKPHERYLLDVISTIGGGNPSCFLNFFLYQGRIFIVLLSGNLPPLKSYIRKLSKSMFFKLPLHIADQNNIPSAKDFHRLSWDRMQPRNYWTFTSRWSSNFCSIWLDWSDVDCFIGPVIICFICYRKNITFILSYAEWMK